MSSPNHYKFYMSTGFTAANSSLTYDISGDLTTQAGNGTTMLANSLAIYNYGNYDLNLQLSMDGSTFGDTQTLRSCQAENFYNAGIKKVKFNHTGNDTKFLVKALARSVSDIDFQPGCVNARLRDKNGNMAEFDTEACGGADEGYFVTVELEHHKIHEGKHYTCQVYDEDVDKASDKYLLVRSPNSTTRIHFTFNSVSALAGTIFFYEDPATSSTGTLLTTYNNDRNSTSLASLEIFEDPGVISDGTNILVNIMAADAKKSGGATKRGDEFILKQNTDYLIRYDTVADNNRITVCNEWYEV